MVFNFQPSSTQLANDVQSVSSTNDTLPPFSEQSTDIKNDGLPSQRIINSAAQEILAATVHEPPSMPTKNKKGVKRKADTTTPVITTVAGKFPSNTSPDRRTESPQGHDSSYNNIEVTSDGHEHMSHIGENAAKVVRTPSVIRREASGRTIRPPRSKDLDSEENVSVSFHCHSQCHLTISYGRPSVLYS